MSRWADALEARARAPRLAHALDGWTQAHRLRRRGAAPLLVLMLLLASTTAFAHTSSVSYSTWRIGPEGVHVDVRVAERDLAAVGLLTAGEAGRPLEGRAREHVLAYAAATLRATSGRDVCAVTGANELPPPAPGWRLCSLSLSCDGESPSRLEIDFLLDRVPGHIHFARLEREGRPAGERVLTFEDRTWRIAAANTTVSAQTDGQGATTHAPAKASTHANDASRAAAAAGSAGATPGASGRSASLHTNSGLAAYVMLGVEHILSGYDHLAFVLALVLLAGTLAEVAWLASAFTLAHSMTLALAAIGLVHPNTHLVEALIGFSIALVAVENAWLLAERPRIVPPVIAAGVLALAAIATEALSFAALTGIALFTLGHFTLLDRSTRPQRVRAAVAFLFGLVHGFGFAGVLAPALPEGSRLVTALFGFNAGVELGQLGVILLVWPLLLLAAHMGARRAVAELGSAAVAGLGTFWFVLRTLGA